MPTTCSQLAPITWACRLPRPSRAARRLLALLLLSPLAALSQVDVAPIFLIDLSGRPIEGGVLWREDSLLDFMAPAPGVPAAASPPVPPVPGRPRIIDQRDKRFVPFVTSVNPGRSVRFPNSDDIRHHVYSFSEGNAFERKLYRANDAEPVTLQVPGVVALGCNIHDNMQAYIVVTGADPLGISDATGAVGVRGGATRYQVWHPMLPDAGKPLLLDVTREADRSIIRLPVQWQDPQAPRSSGDLEALLKKFSNDAP